MHRGNELLAGAIAQNLPCPGEQPIPAIVLLRRVGRPALVDGIVALARRVAVAVRLLSGLGRFLEGCRHDWPPQWQSSRRYARPRALQAVRWVEHRDRTC